MAARRSYWLVKSEPAKYSWDKLVQDGSTVWDGVRNFQARNHLKAMQQGDRVFYYHSNEGLAIVGVAEVAREAYQDPTTSDERWLVVDLKPVEALKRPVTLAEIKQDARLREMALVRQGRLSVSPVTPEEYDAVMELAGRPSA